MKIHHQALIRIPQLPLNASLHHSWEILKESIRLSSSDFYAQIKEVTAEQLETLPRPVYHTIWKYFNRAKYRATPYGSFAGCGLVAFDEATDQQRIVIDEKQILHTYPCWTITGQLSTQDTILTPDIVLFANQTYYQAGEHIRFIDRENDTYILAEIAATANSIAIIQHCKKPMLVSEILKLVQGCTLAELQEMTEAKLLLTADTPNILGEDYFKRIGYESAIDDPKYILSERKVLQSAFNTQAFQDLPDLISIMQHLVPDPARDDLERFKSAFVQKFEDRLIPLMVALDPELGVGYGQLDQAAALEAPIVEPAIANRNDKTALIELLYRSMVASGCKVIQLENLPKPHETAPMQIPTSLGVLCSVVDEHLIIEQVASPSANLLLGRFSLIGDDTTKLCQEIASHEVATNPDILFFDIAYTDEIAVDNVNRRRNIYPYPLYLLNYPDADNSLELSNIYVTVSRNQLVLYDRQLQKRVVPRLSSGYNYKRSNLAVYRFLNDLQFDGTKVNFNLKLSHSFPDEDYYPRVQYKHIVLSPAQWRVSGAAIKRHLKGQITIQSLRDYLQLIGLKKYALTRTEDRTMLFDLDSEADLRELLHIMARFDSFLLEEGFIPSRPNVSDQSGNTYAHQFILTVLNEQPIYPGFIYRKPSAMDKGDIQPIFLPAQDWLYFEIYAHPLRIDELLLGPIYLLLNENADKIETWFFIRYDDHGTHLRLRIKPRSHASRALILSLVNASLREDVQSGIISDIKICTYKREVERYGADLISSVEFHYCTDSRYVLTALHDGLNNLQKYHNCIRLLMGMLAALGEQAENGYTYIDQVCEAFEEEYQLKGVAYKELNKTYREVSACDMPQDQYYLPDYTIFESSAIELLHQCPADRRLKLMADLIHMHLNRIFPASQRTHEMMVYYFCQKMLLRQRALATMKNAAAKLF